MFENFTKEIVLHWKLLLEEYLNNIIYIKRPDNIATCTFSGLPLINYDVK